MTTRTPDLSTHQQLTRTVTENHGLDQVPAKAAKAGQRKPLKIENEDELQTSEGTEVIDDATPELSAGGGQPQATEPMLLAQAEVGAQANAAAGGVSPAAPVPTGATAVIGGINPFVLGGLALGGLGLAAAAGGGGGGGRGGGGGGGDAGGDGAGAGTVPVDSLAPNISKLAITSATSIQNGTLNAGDVLSITVTLSEATIVTGTPQLALTIGGATVQANYASGSGSTSLIFTYTIQSGDSDANGISISANALSLNGGSLKDAANNNATLTHAPLADNGDYLVDTDAPVFASASTASVLENIGIGTVVYDATADGDLGVSYTLGGADRALFNINSTNGAVNFISSPDFEMPADANADNAYDITVIATDAAGNTREHAVMLNVTDENEVNINGSLVAGPITSSGLKVQAQKLVAGQWVNVGQPVDVIDGQYTLNLRVIDAGPIKLVVIDPDNGPDYMDEATLQPKDIDGEMSLVTVITAEGINARLQVAHITPLTTLAANMAQDALGPDADATTIIQNANRMVAGMYGLSTTVDLTQQTPLAVIDQDGNTVEGNAYGAALAVLSGLESQQQMSTSEILASIKANVDVDLSIPRDQIVLPSSAEIFHRIGLHKVGDSSVMGLSENDNADRLGDTGGYYRTFFELSAASYVHIASLNDLPGMLPKDGEKFSAQNIFAEQLKINSLSDLVRAGISFDWQDIFIEPGQVEGRDYAAFFSQGYYLAYDPETALVDSVAGIDTSSVALVGHSSDALFITFRGSDNVGDFWDDGFDMTAHYDLYAPLFEKIHLYLGSHPEITDVYVSGHSLGGQMASMFMQRHPDGTMVFKNDGTQETVIQRQNPVEYHSVTFEPANKLLGYFDYGIDDERAVGFEMREDWVPDLSLPGDYFGNYGKTVFLDYEKSYGGAFPAAHFMASLDQQIDRVFQSIPLQQELGGLQRYYVDDDSNGVVVTNAGSTENFLGNLEDMFEYQATGYVLNTTFDAPGSCLVIQPLDAQGDDYSTYTLFEENVQTVILGSDSNIDIDARQSNHNTLLIGSSAQNFLIGSASNDILVGSGDDDLLAGGDGNDVLYGGNYRALWDIMALPDASLPFAYAPEKNHAAIAEALNTYADNTSSDDVSFLYGGRGSDTLVGANDNDYFFVDVTLGGSGNASNVDRIRNFDSSIDNDYLVFSAAQLGIDVSSLTGWGWGAAGLGLVADWKDPGKPGTDFIAYQAPDLLGDENDYEEHFFRVANINEYTYANSVGNPYLRDIDSFQLFADDPADTKFAWILDESNGNLYFDADGNADYGDQVLVATLTASELDNFNASRLLLLPGFDIFNPPVDASNPVPINHNPSGSVAVSGNLEVGQTLQASNTLNDADGMGVVGYIWQASASGSSGWVDVGTGETLTLTEAHQDKHIRVLGSYTDGTGTTEAIFSPASAAVEAAVVIDMDAPVWTSAASATVAENAAASSAAYIAQATDANPVTYSLWNPGSDPFDNDLFEIDASSGAVTFKVSPDFEAPADANGDNVYDIFIKAEDSSYNVRSQVVQITVTDEADSTGYIPGQAVIDLGENGKLINPVRVEGNWYYAWDMNGDGAHDFNQNAGSTISQYDYVSHGILDGVFTHDINGNTGGGGNTTETYRYATLNGVKLALPTANGGLAYPNGMNAYQPGTIAADGVTNNTSYNDLLAIWDAHNGAGVGATSIDGTPSGWRASTTWSATPSGSGHVNLSLNGGYINDNHSGNGYVILQVMANDAPIFSSGTTVSVGENISTGTTVLDVTANNDLGVSYTIGGTDGALFDIDAASGIVSFKASPDYEAPADAGANNVYDFTVTATDFASNTATQDVQVNLTDVAEAGYTRGQAVIDLGEYGKLINPVQVDGDHWYYAWDINSDGVHSASPNSAGKFDSYGNVVNVAGSGYQFDFTNHDVLDEIFGYAANFSNLNPGADTDNTYRFAEINGVMLALPSVGNGELPATTFGRAVGTDIDNNPTGEANPTYDDLLAIWDANNGSGIGSGVPSGWDRTRSYASATPTALGHAFVDLNGGDVNHNYDHLTGLAVAVQVL